MQMMYESSLRPTKPPSLVSFSVATVVDAHLHSHQDEKKS